MRGVEDLLDRIQGWDELPALPVFHLDPESLDQERAEWMRRLGVDSLAGALRKHIEIRTERRWQNLLLERDQGRGTEQQRRLLTRKISDLLGTQYGSFVWDERGRRAEGLDEIILSHVATMFLATGVDVLVCSVCGQPFPFDESPRGRRPRFGVRRFCGDACRREAKRESNRLSWRRKEAKWRRRSTSRPANQERISNEP